MDETIRIYCPHPSDPQRLDALAHSNAPVRIYLPSDPQQSGQPQ